MMHGRWRTLFTLWLGTAALGGCQTGDAETCRELGFNTDICSNCPALSQYVDDTELSEDCKRCCAEESATDGGSGKFTSAVLQVCKHRLREFPTVDTFVKEKAASFEGLTIEYRFGSAPRLVLRGGKGQKESLRVDRWKTEHIEEFLTDKLQVKSVA